MEKKIHEISQVKKVRFEPTTPRCANCRHWHCMHVSSFVAANDDGECRLHPPTSAAVMVQRATGPEPAVLPMRVRTCADNWCGDHPAIQAQLRADYADAVDKRFSTLWDDKSGFKRAPTLDEARRFQGLRGEPDGFAEPVAPEPGSMPLESVKNPFDGPNSPK